MLEPDYDTQSRKLSKGEYEVTVNASYAAEIKDMKKAMRKKAAELCGSKKYARPRSVREDNYRDPPSQKLTGQFECVG